MSRRRWEASEDAAFGGRIASGSEQRPSASDVRRLRFLSASDVLPAIPGSMVRLLAVVLVLSPLGPQCCCAQGPINEITSVVGGTALLPCDIVPPLPNDSVILVIWFKNEVTPIYR
ncbi:Uncharacterized protein GBIM_13948 [Gryllus bimaculatus]|nr:Uncharacterized protein GBIM_13948 [Gryllus bimaculatus]